MSLKNNINGLPVLLAIVSLIVMGLSYQSYAKKWGRENLVKLQLPVPLENFPKAHQDWIGVDAIIAETTLKVAGNDDYLSRNYTSKDTKYPVHIYVAYSGRPRNMKGHRPQVCYPSSGWVADNLEHISFKTTAGLTINALLHEFHMPTGGYRKNIVLDYYIVNGKFMDNEAGFSGLAFRAPNVDGKNARYVAHVEFTSQSEASVRKAAEDFSDELTKYFPDEAGVIKVLSIMDEKNSTKTQLSTTETN